MVSFIILFTYIWHSIFLLDDDAVSAHDDVNEDLKNLTAEIEGNLNDVQESDTEELFKTCMNDSDFRDLATTYINDKDLKELVKENLGDADLNDVVNCYFGILNGSNIR